MTWGTQPICNRCWEEMHPGRDPVRLKVPEREHCAWCNTETFSGIYLRARSDAVPYPS